MRLPDKITASRFFFGLLMVFFAYFNIFYAFTALYVVAIMSDIADGFFARKLKQESQYGKKLDIIADNFILICLAVSFYLIKREIILAYLWHILALLGYFFIVQAINLKINKKVIFMRTYVANLAAIVFPLVIFGFLIFDAKYIAYGYIFLMYYSLAEKLFLSVSREEAPSLFLIKSRRIKFFFIITYLITLSLVSFIPVDNSNSVCFQEGYCINVEIRNTPEGRELGLMFRDNMSEKEGMLFVFDEPVTYAFWMKNMKIPIDIIFISTDKRIVSISADAKPCTKPDNECELYYPAGQYLYVVETVANFSLNHNLSTGQGVKI